MSRRSRQRRSRASARRRGSYLAAGRPLFVASALVVAFHLLANAIAVACYPQAIHYHAVGGQKALVACSLGLAIVYLPFVCRPERLSVPFSLGIAVLCGSAVANGLSVALWSRGVPDYLHSSGALYFHPGLAATANTADLGITIGMIMTVAAVTLFPLTRPRSG